MFNKKNTLVQISTTLLIFLMATMILNHKELFSIYTWNLLPVRFISGLVIINGFVLLVIYKNKLLDIVFEILILLFLFISLSSLVSSNISESFIYSLFYLFVAFLYIMLKFLFKNTKEFVDVFINFYLLTVFISIVIVIFQIIVFYSNDKLFGAVWPVPGNIPRFGALFWDINHFGLFLVIGIWLLFYKFLKDIRKFSYKNALHLLFILITFCTLVLTSSRSAILGFLVGMSIFVLVYFLTYRKNYFRNFLYKLSQNIIIIFPFIILIFTYLFGTLVRNFFFYRIHSFFTHFILLGIGFDLFKQNPFLGVGANNFGRAFQRSKFFREFALLDPGALDNKVPIHSVWFQFLTESGFIAFLLFLVFSSFTLYLLYKAYRKEKNIFYLILFSSFLGILISSIFYSYNLEFYWLYIVFCILMGFSEFTFKSSQFKVFVKGIFSIKIGISIIIFLYFIVLTSSMDIAPNVDEISMFNLAKTIGAHYPIFDRSIFIFPYFKLLNSFQYMLGYFPYVGRLVSLIFTISSLSILFIYLKDYFNRKKALALSISIILSATYVFRILEISPASYFFYLVMLSLFLISSLINKLMDEKVTNYKINIPLINKSNSTILLYFLMIISMFLGFLVYKPFHLKSYQPEVSNLIKSLARKYSLNDFIFVTDIEGIEKVVRFYTEPITPVHDSLYKFTGKNYIYITKNEFTTQNYDAVVSGESMTFAYVKFEEE